MNPHARQDNLVVQEVGDELVVYDKERYRAHRLNRSAALVWRHCDGKTTVADLAALLQSELNAPADKGLVWLALDQLGKAHLLREKMTRPTNTRGVSRRQILRKLGAAAAAVLVPVVTSLVAPASGRAQLPPPQQTYCMYTITAVGRPCNFTPAPAVGDIVCALCPARRNTCPVLPRVNCIIRMTVLRRVVICRVTLAPVPVAAACGPCPPNPPPNPPPNVFFAGITC